MDLKRKAQDFSYPGMQRRYLHAVEFMEKHGFVFPVLDVGPENAFGKRIAERFNYEYHHTEGDLNYSFWYPTAQTIFETATCFEVVEHLKNPDCFMLKLARVAKVVYVSFPVHSFSWSPTHFHEYDEARFKELAEGAGYEIVEKKTYPLVPQVTGIRSFLKAFLFWRWVGRQYFYLLRVK